VTNVNGATSQDVSWTVEEEGESQPWLIFALVVLVLVAGAWVVSNQAAKAAIEKSKANQEAEPAEDKSYLEDDEIDADGVEKMTLNLKNPPAMFGARNIPSHP